MDNNMEYQKCVELYNDLINQLSEIERKGKTMPYTSINGHMFSFLNKDGQIGLRLSKTDLAEFIELYKAEQMIQHGRVMKEYVSIPVNVLDNTEVLSSYFKKSLDYVSGLKPKPTKKKK